MGEKIVFFYISDIFYWKTLMWVRFSQVRHDFPKACIFNWYWHATTKPYFFVTKISISIFIKNIFFKVVRSRKLDLKKIDNFAFKNSNIIIEGLIWKQKIIVAAIALFHLESIRVREVCNVARLIDPGSIDPDSIDTSESHRQGRLPLVTPGSTD